LKASLRRRSPERHQQHQGRAFHRDRQVGAQGSRSCGKEGGERLMEAELSALLATAAPRRFWGRAPQAAPQRPYVVLSRVSGVRGYHNQGDDGLVASRVQIDCFADTYIAALNTGNAVISTLTGYRGGTIQAVFI